MTFEHPASQATTAFHQKALAFNNVTLSYIARGAPLDHLLDRIAGGFSQTYPTRSLAVFLFDASARRMRVGAAPCMAPPHVQHIETLEVDAPDTPQFWALFQAVASIHGATVAEMLPLRSFAGDVAGILVVCGAPGAADDGLHADPAYRQTVGAAVSMAMLSIERSLAPDHIRPPIETAGPSHERMALAIEGSGTGIWDRNAVTGEIYYSRGWKAILGYEDWELSNHIEDAYKRVHPDDLAYVQETIRKHFQARSDTYVVEHRILCRDGSYKWISSRGKVVARDSEGNALRMIGTTTDITEVKQLTDKLRKSSELLADLTSEIPGMGFQ
ncbi:PAS domain-containing protein [Herbaspirillum sp. LeCh32-8]|uniref:PAS domain-containing protein n=1 Tax=Herbaspirillum sp. LeCh32-8 TaxID=2821356 RepID=UPI001FD75106|nr:PAS domain-containing protein [Herbaspirillum sp. LeCh32-8]